MVHANLVAGKMKRTEIAAKFLDALMGNGMISQACLTRSSYQPLPRA
jgi:hypothetical protein